MAVYHKLVRDFIPEHIALRGGEVTIHVADEAEYQQKLAEKLVEEAGEFLKDRNREELADVLEVFEAILISYGFSRQEVEQEKEKKKKEKGAFEKRIILEEA